MSRLAGKVAIVTGGSTGLGREIAQLYARQGARVAIGDIRPDEGNATAEAIRSAGGDALFAQTDVSSSSSVEALVAETEAHFGAVHVMTANAGILGRAAGKSVPELTDDEVAQVMNVNFGGVLNAFRFAIPAILRAGGGAMTATTSMAAHRGYPKLPLYCASKGAVVALVRSVAADVAPAIRVNAVSPGSMETEIGAHTAEDRGDAGPVGAAAGNPFAIERTEPLIRRAHPLEVAYTHLYLVSDEASFVVGQTIEADGGRALLP